MQPWLSRLQTRHWIGIALFVVLAVSLGGYVFVKFNGWAWVRQLKVADLVAQIVALGPWVFFGALAVLPAFGFPVSPFYLFAAGAFGLPLALFGTLTALAINVALSFGLARSVMHPAVEWLVQRMGRTVPQVRPQDQWMVTLLLRITPGPPFFMQSYLLALGGIPFGVYMAVSVAVAWFYGAAFVIFGETLLSGSASKILFGVGLVVAVIVIIRLVRQRLQARAAAVLPPGAGLDK